MRVTTAGVPVNLTALGTADWKYYGPPTSCFLGPCTKQGKAGGSGLSGAYAAAAPDPNFNGDYPNPTIDPNVNTSWTDGDTSTGYPAAGSSLNAAGLNTSSAYIDAVADSTQRTLTVVGGGGYGAGITVRVTAHLSDGSAPDFVDTVVVPAYTRVPVIYTLSYAAAGPGAYLRVTFTRISGPHSMILQAAALSSYVAPLSANVSGTSVRVTTAGVPVNLTALGTADWKYYGPPTSCSLGPCTTQGKAGGSGLSGAYAAAAPDPNFNGDYPNPTIDPNVNTSWTDGDTSTGYPAAGSSLNAAGLNTSSAYIDAVADSTQRTLTVVGGGGYGAGITVRVTAHLSDGSAPDFVDTVMVPAYTRVPVIYTLSYAAAGPGAHLRVTFTRISGPHNMILQAAALSGTSAASIPSNPVSLPATFTIAKATILLTAGQTASLTVSVSSTAGYTGTVTPTITSALPSGVSASPCSQTIRTSGSCIITLTAASSAAAFGPGQITISGTDGRITRTAAVTLTVATFKITTPALISLTQGATTSIPITVLFSTGFTGTVTPAITSILPSGVTASPCSPAVLTVSGTCTITLTATGSALTGSTAAVFSATISGMTQSLSSSLAVLAMVSAVSAPGTTLTTRVFPAAQDIPQTFNGFFTVYYKPSVTLATPISPSVSGLPSGCTASFTPSTVPATGGPTAGSVTCGGTTPTGNATINFSGNSGAVVATSAPTSINVVACCMAPVAGTTTTLALGADLQAAVNNAHGGDTLILPDGYKWNGTLKLPYRAPNDTQWITIKSNLNLPDGQRVQPGEPKATISNVDLNPAIQNDIDNPDRTKHVTHHWKFDGLMVTTAPSYTGTTYSLITMWVLPANNTDPMYAKVTDLCHHIEFHHMYIHGSDNSPVGRGIRPDANHVVIKDNWIDNIRSTFLESNAVCSPTHQGDITLDNNFLESAGENVFFGAAPDIFNLVGSGYTVTNNYFYKRLSWRGSPYTVKNVLEWKGGQNIRVDHNVFENNWQAQQSGAVFLLTPRTGNGAYNDIFVRNVTFTDNIIRHAPQGVSMLDYDNGAAVNGAIPIAKLTLSGNYTFRNNLLEDMSGLEYANSGIAAGYGFAMSGLPDNVTLDSNTVRFHEGLDTTPAVSNWQVNMGMRWGSNFQYLSQGVDYSLAALSFRATNNMFGAQLFRDSNFGPAAVPYSYGGDCCNVGTGTRGSFTGNAVLNVYSDKIAAWNAAFPDTVVKTGNTYTGPIGANTSALLSNECAIKTGNRTTGVTCTPGQYPSNITP